MNILISNGSPLPIYAQIVEQIKGLITSGQLEVGATLPSMRVLAQELRISVITTKRAYEELERDGFISSITGKGSFVCPKNLSFIKEQQYIEVEKHLAEAVRGAAIGGITKEELWQMLELAIKGE